MAEGESSGECEEAGTEGSEPSPETIDMRVEDSPSNTKSDDISLEETEETKLTPKDLEEFLQSHPELRIEHPHKWNLLSWLKQYTNLKSSAKIIDGIKGAWYLFKALTEPSTNRNPFKDIDNGAAYIFLPGMLSIPQDPSLLEKNLGKVAYVESTDVAVLKQVVDYMVSKRGEVRLIGFSDGGKTIENYIAVYGMRNIQSIHAIATNPVTVNPRVSGPGRYSHSRLHYILGSRDMIAPAEKDYPDRFGGVSGIQEIDCGHTWFFQDKETANTAANMIKGNVHHGKIYPNPRELIAGLSYHFA